MMEGMEEVVNIAPDIVTTGVLLNIRPPCGDCIGVLTQLRITLGDIGGASDFVA
jgi:hypothetical protein